MGLKAVFQKGAQTAYKAAGDVLKDVRYEVQLSSVYDVSAGHVSVISRNYFFSMLFETYKQMEIDDVHIKPTDLRASFAQLTCPGVTPNTNDSVHVCDAYGSTEYEVMNIVADPADAQWVLQLRARGKGSS